MTTPSFNLVDDPWIPCLAPGTTRARELSLGELSESAGELTGIWCQSPLETAALHRLVLAVTHSALRGPTSFADGRALLADGRLPTKVRDYLVRWRERFELFDRERPFYQQAHLPDAKESTISRLYHEHASLSQATLFDHHLDAGGPGVSRAQVARALVTHQGYALATGPPKNPFYDAPLAGRLCVLPQGRTLAETIALSLVRYTDDAPIPRDEYDAPAWEQEAPTMPSKNGSIPRGYLDYLTWQARAVQLLPGERVAACRYRQNLKLAESPMTIDPLVPYRTDNKRGFVPMRLRPERVLWRDLDAIIHGTLRTEDHPYGVLGWAAEISDAATPCGLLVAGMARNPRKAQVEHWSLARLPLTDRLLADAHTREALTAALGYATTGEHALSGAYRRAKLLVAPASEQRGTPAYEAKAVCKTAVALQRKGVYWPALEPAFAALVEQISTIHDEEREAAILDWAERVRGAAGDALERIVENFHGARGLRAATGARQELHRGLAELPRRTAIPAMAAAT